MSPKLLLLLHLLELEERWMVRRLLRSLDQNAPVVGNGHLAIESRGMLIGFDLHRDVEFAFSFTPKKTVGRRDIMVVTPHCSPDVAMMSD